MQTTGFLDAKPRHPGALATVIAIHAVGIGALILFAPTVIKTTTTILEGRQIPLPPVPPGIVKEDPIKIKTKAPPVIDQVKPYVAPMRTDEDPGFTRDTGPLTAGGVDEGLGGGIDIIEIDPPKDAVIVGPQFTGRNAQPPYPPGMQRMNIEGAVTVRVLVGTDGRPVRIEMVRTDQDAFFAATREWGMKNWRFKPATRDGEPFQEWRTMTVRFEMNGAD
jgi:periplasmic protein TonB